MKITRHAGGGDFYESFSDLIFGTLIIFLVVVLALMVQVQKAAERLDKMIGGIVLPHRFAGGTGGPKVGYAILPSEFTGKDEIVIVMFPWNVYEIWNEPREPGVTDPVLDLCRGFLDGSLLMLTQSEFFGMAEDLTPRLIGLGDDADGQHIEAHQYGEIVCRILTLKRRIGARMNSMSAEEVRDSIGGFGLFEYGQDDQTVINSWFLNPAFPFAYEYDFYYNWINAGGDEWRSERSLWKPMRERTRQFLSDPSPGIRLRLTADRKVLVGDTVLTTNQFISLLACISPGRGFVVEYVNDEGEAGAPPPGWFEDEVLFPAGYDSRILKRDDVAS